MLIEISISISRSVVSDFLRPHGLQPTRLLCPWDSLGKNTGVGCHFLHQGTFPTVHKGDFMNVHQRIPQVNCHRKLSLEPLNSIPILHLWLADCLFLYLGFKVNDLGLFVSINLIVNLFTGYYFWYHFGKFIFSNRHFKSTELYTLLPEIDMVTCAFSKNQCFPK